MLRFCEVCRKIQDERWMHTDDICELCHSTADERRMTKDTNSEPESKDEPGPAGEVEQGPYLPGLSLAQGETE